MEYVKQRVGGQKTGLTALWTDVNRLDVEESKIELQLFHEVHVVQGAFRRFDESRFG